MNFNIERQRIELLSEGARKREEESAGRMRVLQNALKNGEVSSGDNVTDFVVAQYGIFDDAFERPYRNLRESLQDNVGAEVLVVRKTRTEEDMFDMGSLTERDASPVKRL